MTKHESLFFISITLSVLFICSLNLYSSPVSNYPSYDIKLSNESSLDYGEYVSFHMEVDENDKLDWEFSGTNNYVGITVYAMTDSEFYKFQNLLTFYAYTLSNGSYYRASGTFKPPSHDTWYVVFLNIDSSLQITYLTYDVDIIRGNEWLMTFLGPIIAVLVIGGVLSLVCGLGKKGKKEQVDYEKNKFTNDQRVEESINIKNQQNQNDIKYCSKCGTIHKAEAVYCEKCGYKFSSF